MIGRHNDGSIVHQLGVAFDRAQDLPQKTIDVFYGGVPSTRGPIARVPNRVRVAEMDEAVVEVLARQVRYELVHQGGSAAGVDHGSSTNLVTPRIGVDAKLILGRIHRR